MFFRLPGALRTLRFRLTAFYTLLLAIVIFGLAIGLLTIIEHELRKDLDHRLQDTVGLFLDGISRPGMTVFKLPPLDPYLSSDLLLQFTDTTGTIDRSSNLGNQVLPVWTKPNADSPYKYQDETVDGVRLRVLDYAYYTQDGFYGGILTVATPLGPLERTLELLRSLLLYGAIIGVVGAGTGGWLLANRALRPIDRITQTAAEIAAGGGSSESLRTRLVEPRTDDEVARLARTFNTMLDRIENAFLAQRRFLADASHELRTPLTALRGNADVLRKQADHWSGLPDQDEIVAALDDLQHESARMGRLLADLLQLARSDAPEAVAGSESHALRIDLLARDAARAAVPLGSGQTIAVAAEPLTILGNPDRLRQLLLILLDNALRHSASDGHVTLAIERVPEDAVTMTVHDDGEGIDAIHLPHIFDRFYRVDTARSRATGGTGLGLAIARGIVAEQSGDISVESTVGAGTTFTVRLPISPQRAGDALIVDFG